MRFSMRKTEIERVAVWPLLIAGNATFSAVKAEQPCNISIQWQIARNAGTVFVWEADPILFDKQSAGAFFKRPPAIDFAADVSNVRSVFAHCRADLARTLSVLRSQLNGFAVSRREEPG